VEYEKTNGENLLDSMFKELTKEEVEKKFEEIGKLMYVLVKSFKGLGGQ
jgi:hypothetical protein